MADIAARVGVSKVTVSAVLSASAGNRTRVSEATRRRVLAAATELNYTPNGIAKMFRARRTDIIGLYLGDRMLNTHDLFLAEIVSGLQLGCQEHGKDLLIHSTFQGRPLGHIHSELINRKIDGLLMFAAENDPLAVLLASSPVPVIAIADAVPVLPSVVADDRGGSILVANYLASKGHTRVLYRRGYGLQASANRRYEAFCASADGLGMVVLDDKTRLQEFDFVLSASEKALLAGPNERPTAIVCANDLLASAALDYCREQGYAVPGDYAVVGFDGIPPQIRPAAYLTTIHVPWPQVAQTALDLVVKSLSGELIPQETVLPVDLVRGETA